MQLDQTLQTLLTTLTPDDHLGVLLAAQMGGTPQEVQLIVQTTENVDGDDKTIRVTGQYIIRCIGVVEQQLSLGFFQNMVHSADNALLHQYNHKIVYIHFKGEPANVDSLMIDINQLYGQTYGHYNPLRRMVDEINHADPLATLLTSGEGLFGRVPEPFAHKLRKLFEQHQMEVTFIEVEAEAPDPHHPPITYQSLVLDDSYIIAQLFSADPLRGSEGGTAT